MADRHARVNERIRAREIRVIDEDGKQLGIMPPYEAIKIARGKGLDVVEVAPAANPPVCRIINYGKFLYQQSKRQHEARKHQRSVEIKEVKFRPRTSGHDFEVKRNRIVQFLQDGTKVKATIMFRGREMAHRDIGMHMMERLIAEISEVGQAETRPRQEGPNLSAILAPKKAPGKTVAPKVRTSGESQAVSERAARPSRSGPGARMASAAKPAGTSGG